MAEGPVRKGKQIEKSRGIVWSQFSMTPKQNFGLHNMTIHMNRRRFCGNWITTDYYDVRKILWVLEFKLCLADPSVYLNVY